jgi:hypothetical protein
MDGRILTYQFRIDLGAVPESLPIAATMSQKAEEL